MSSLLNSIILFRLSLGAIGGLFLGPNVKISLLDVDHSPAALVQKLQKFESIFTYPFSDTEEFRIKHGTDGDYFAFFKTLGKPYFYVAECIKDETVTKTVNGKQITIQHKAGDIAAVGCGILREMQLKTEDKSCDCSKQRVKTISAWYICDLKVNPHYQGEHLPTAIINKVGALRFLQCPRGFGICMNPPEGEPKAAAIFKKHGQFPGLQVQTLNLYSLTAQSVTLNKMQLEETLKRHGYLQRHEKLSFKSTHGNKDYQIFNKDNAKDTRPWNLMHMQAGQEDSSPKDNADYMICSVQDTPLDQNFKTILGKPSSTAQIVSYGMQNVDFNYLSSNQI